MSRTQKAAPKGDHPQSGAVGDEPSTYGDIVRRILEVADPDKIILFGSRARGDHRPDSDLDLLVIQKSSKPRYARAGRLYRALARLPVEVDILVYTPKEVREWSRVPQAFVTTAIGEGVILYERSG
jgi:predicted nucleotidyltransferase